MIPIEKEPAELYEEFHLYENCIFCNSKTDTWHVKTNQPVCRQCSVIHNVQELKPAWVK